MTRKNLFLVTLGLLFLFTASVAFFSLTKPENGKVLYSPIGQIVRNVRRIRTVELINLSVPTLKEVFSNSHSWTATLSGEKKLVLIATGDVIPARVTNFRAAVELKDFLWPWRKTADVLKSADVTLINLESPIFVGCAPTRQSTFVFCGDGKHALGMLFAGVDVASLANNHAGNFGNEGITKTVAILKDAGITPFGISDPVYREFKGVRLAFLGYNDVGVEIDLEKMAEEIKDARRNADLVIVEYHWGTEYITPPEERQIEIGHLAIDSGADLVIGNHPHWIKPIEFYQGKLITYGHGNFIFDQEWSAKTKEGVVGKYTFYCHSGLSRISNVHSERDSGVGPVTIGPPQNDEKCKPILIDVEYLPVRIEDYGQPYFLEGSEKQRILSEMAAASDEILKQ